MDKSFLVHREKSLFIPIILQQNTTDITATFNGYGLVDSGATISLMNEKVARMAGFRWDHNDNVNYLSSNGGHTKTCGGMTLKLSNEDKNTTVATIKVFVSKSLPMDLMLGLNFLKLAVLDLPNRRFILHQGMKKWSFPVLDQDQVDRGEHSSFLREIELDKSQQSVNHYFGRQYHECFRRHLACQADVTPDQEEDITIQMKFGALETDIKAKLLDLIWRYQSVFKVDVTDTLYTGPNCRELDLKITSETYSRPKKLMEIPERARSQFQEQIKSWLKAGIIEPQTKPVPYINGFISVSKPNGQIRFCLDARHLNSTVEFEDVALENVDDLALKLSRFPILTHVDVSNFYLSFPVSERTADLLTFRGVNGEYYKFKRSIFGVRGSAAHAINITREALSSLDFFNVRLFCYCDDLLLASSTYEEMLQDLQKIFDLAQRCNFKFKPSKASFGLQSLVVFGYQVSEGKVEIAPARRDALLNILPPTNKTQLLKHLGSLSYYRKSFPMDKPLAKFQQAFRHLVVGTSFQWSAKDQENWIMMHQALSEAVSRSSLLVTDDIVYLKSDASKNYCGWLVSCIRDKHEYIITTGSKTFPLPYQKFNACRLELIGVLIALKACFHHLYLRTTVVVTDNASVLYIINNPNSVSIVEPSLIARLFHEVALLKFTAKKSTNADRQWPLVDALSRNTKQQVITHRNIHQLLQDEEYALVTTTVKASDLSDEDIKFLGQTVENCPIQVVNKLNDLVVQAHLHPTFLRLGLIAKEHQASLVELAHSLGHIGYVKLTSLMNHLNLRWKNRSETILEVLKSCKTCTTLKNSTQGRFSQQVQDTSSVPFESIGLDLNTIGQGSHSVTLLVIVDHCTNFIWATKVRQPVDAKNVLKSLMDFIVTWAPSLKSVTTDNGVQFRSRLFQVCMKDLHVRISFASRFNSQGNSKTELANKKINCMLRYQQIDPFAPNFEFKLKAALMKINLEHNGKTKLSAYNVLFGIEPLVQSQPLHAMDDCPPFTGRVQLLRQLKSLYGGYPELFPQFALQVGDVVRLLVAQKKGQNKIKRLRYSDELYKIVDRNLQSLTYKLTSMTSPDKDNIIYSHHRHVKFIRSGVTEWGHGQGAQGQSNGEEGLEKTDLKTTALTNEPHSEDPTNDRSPSALLEDSSLLRADGPLIETMEKPGQSSRDDEGSVVVHPVGLDERKSQNKQQGDQRRLHCHRGDAESQDGSSSEGEESQEKENFKSLFKSLKKFPKCQYKVTFSLAYDGHDIGQLKTKVLVSTDHATWMTSDAISSLVTSKCGKITMEVHTEWLFNAVSKLVESVGKFRIKSSSASPRESIWLQFESVQQVVAPSHKIFVKFFVLSADRTKFYVSNSNRVIWQPYPKNEGAMKDNCDSRNEDDCQQDDSENEDGIMTRARRLRYEAKQKLKTAHPVQVIEQRKGQQFGLPEQCLMCNGYSRHHRACPMSK